MQPHRLDPLSLFAGLIFIAVAVVGLVDQLTIGMTDLRWLMPGALVGFGLILVLGAARNRSEARSGAARPGESSAAVRATTDEVSDGERADE